MERSALASGASGLAVGGAVAILSRLVDRAGQTRVLATTALLVLACAGLLAAAVLAHAPPGVVAALAALAGASTPPVSPCMRTLWPRLVGRERLDTAYAFDALTLELAFIVGPLLTAGLADGVSPWRRYSRARRSRAPGRSCSPQRRRHGPGVPTRRPPGGGCTRLRSPACARSSPRWC